jgi:hypothetical protein
MAGGFELLALDTSFIWNGSSNLLVDVCFDLVSNYNSSGQVYTFPYMALNAASQYQYRTSDDTPQCNNTTSSANTSSKPQLQLQLNALPPCTGSPMAGNPVSSNTLVCANTGFNLNLINGEIASGIEFQWQSSTDGSNWVNLGSSQTNWLYSINSITVTTYYQCITTCTASAQSSTSTPIVVNLNPLLNCYCMPYWPNYIVDCQFDRIADFSLANVVSQGTTCDSYGFSDSTISNYTSINLTAGNTYTLLTNTILSGSNGNGAVGAWIDYNQNAVFDSNEFISLGFGPSGTYSTSLTVPITAIGGSVRIRIMLDAYYAYSGTILNPCSSNSGNLGQILDYKVNITPAPACSGAPNAGDAMSTSTAVCQNVSYTLDLVNNGFVSDITYQWQSSADNNTWLNLGTVQNTIPYFVTSQNATTYYRCVATCVNSALSGTSTPVMVLQNLPTACYCNPGTTYCSSVSIYSVSISNLDYSPTCNYVDGYTNYTDSVPAINLTAGQTYNLLTAITTFSSSPDGHVSVWIDYDQNGVFDAYEFISVGSYTTGTLSQSVNVPFTVPGGNTRMRIKLETDNYNYPGADPCSSSGSNGQTLDYLVNVIPSPACSGTPNAGDAVSPISQICENTSFSLDLVNNDLVSNVTYQWQVSIDSTFWTNLGTSQNGVPYTIASQNITSYYRCLTTCTTSALTSTSTPFKVIQNPLIACYCIPPVSICSNNDEINNVLFANLSNTSTCSNNGYEDYSGSVASATITAGQSYPIAIQVGSDYYGKVSAWIDYNQNGIFESTEYDFSGTTNSAGNFIINDTITIPTNALIGNTKMRIRNNNQFPFNANQACAAGNSGDRSPTGTGSIGNGETEDYLITILAPDCGSINIPQSISIIGTSDMCLGNIGVLDLSPALPTATGITYQWKSFNGTIFVNDGLASDTSAFATSPSASKLYYCEIMCNGTPVLISDTFLVKVTTITTAAVITNITCNGLCNGAIALNAASLGSVLSYSWITTGDSTDVINNLCPGIYTVYLKNTTGCFVAESYTITEPASITATSAKTDVSCFGLSDGTGSMTVSGGTSPLSYTWFPNGGNNLTASNLSAGNYTFSLVDGNNCTLNEIFTINEPPVLTAMVTNTLGSCFGGSNGQAQILVGGGTPGYSYNWSSGGTNSLETNLAAGTYSCSIIDAKLCSNIQTVIINQSSATFSVSISGKSSTCEQLEDTITSSITGSGASPFIYSWTELPGNIVSVDSNFIYTSAIGTYSYNLNVTDANNCIVNSNTISVSVNPSSNFSGTVTTFPALPVAGRVILYKYLPFYTRFDSVAGQDIGASGDYNFTSFTSGVYIVKAIPTANNLQIAYGDTAVNWKTAKQIIHGCAVNDIQNINVKALSTFTTSGTGSLSGQIRKGDGFLEQRGFGFKPLFPGQPIGGIIVKGGRNPGGQMFVQTTTDTLGNYTLQGLPINVLANEEYFILVDIPGLDTNNTYHQKITLTNNQFVNLDFVVDSAKINPVHITDVSVHDISAIEHQIKVFPNPANNKVTIQYNLLENSNVKIELYNIIGESLKTILPLTEQSNNNYSYTVQLNDLTTGMYFMKLKINNSESIIKLVISN